MLPSHGVLCSYMHWKLGAAILGTSYHSIDPECTVLEQSHKGIPRKTMTLDEFCQSPQNLSIPKLHV